MPASNEESRMATRESDEFGQALTRLEEIVGKLEQGNLPLHDSVALFKEGTQLAQRCSKLLADAQATINALSASVEAPGDGGPKVEGNHDGLPF